MNFLGTFLILSYRWTSHYHAISVEDMKLLASTIGNTSVTSKNSLISTCVFDKLINKNLQNCYQTHYLFCDINVFLVDVSKFLTRSGHVWCEILLNPLRNLLHHHRRYNRLNS